MVTDVYSEIVDEDRRLNAKKMEKDFYKSLELFDPDNEPKSDQENKNTNTRLEGLNENQINALLASISTEEKERLL